MIGYGLAFVIGFCVAIVCRGLSDRSVLPWTPALYAWGVVFVGLNWVASLG